MPLYIYILFSVYNNSYIHDYLANGRSPLNMDRPLEHDRHPLAITAAEAVAASGVNPWSWRDPSVNGKVLVCLLIEIYNFFICFFLDIILKTETFWFDCFRTFMQLLDALLVIYANISV